MFVKGVRAFADAAQSIERRDAHPGGKVSVGAAAHRCFFELPVNMPRDRLSFFVEGDYAFCPLHGQAVDAASDNESAVFVERFQGTKLTIQNGGLLRILDANVDLGGGLGCDYVGTSSAANHTWVHGHAATQIIHPRDGGDL